MKVLKSYNASVTTILSSKIASSASFATDTFPFYQKVIIIGMIMIITAPSIF